MQVAVILTTLLVASSAYMSMSMVKVNNIHALERTQGMRSQRTQCDVVLSVLYAIEMAGCHVSRARPTMSRISFLGSHGWETAKLVQACAAVAGGLS